MTTTTTTTTTMMPTLEEILQQHAPSCEGCGYKMDSSEISTICDLCRAEKNSISSMHVGDPMEARDLSSQSYWSWIEAKDTMETLPGQPTGLERSGPAPLVQAWQTAYQADAGRLSSLYLEYGIPVNTSLSMIIGRDSSDEEVVDHFHIETSSGIESEAWSAAQVYLRARRRREAGEDVRQVICKDPLCTASAKYRRGSRYHDEPREKRTRCKRERKTRRLLDIKRSQGPAADAHKSGSNGYWYTDHFHLIQDSVANFDEAYTLKQANDRRRLLRQEGTQASIWACAIPGCELKPKRYRRAKAYQVA